MLKKRTKKNGVEENEENENNTNNTTNKTLFPRNQHITLCVRERELKVDRSRGKNDYNRSKEEQTENVVVTLFSSANK